MPIIGIKGHRERGREVISLLESFGGVNSKNYSGVYSYYHYDIPITYYISSDLEITSTFDSIPLELESLSLEEFEKLFKG
jgi:hypothetical protein